VPGRASCRSGDQRCTRRPRSWVICCHRLVRPRTETTWAYRRLRAAGVQVPPFLRTNPVLVFSAIAASRGTRERAAAAGSTSGIAPGTWPSADALRRVAGASVDQVAEAGSGGCPTSRSSASEPRCRSCRLLGLVGARPGYEPHDQIAGLAFPGGDARSSRWSLSGHAGNSGAWCASGRTQA
jgi:hypothetical protein